MPFPAFDCNSSLRKTIDIVLKPNYFQIKISITSQEQTFRPYLNYISMS